MFKRSIWAFVVAVALGGCANNLVTPSLEELARICAQRTLHPAPVTVPRLIRFCLPGEACSLRAAINTANLCNDDEVRSIVLQPDAKYLFAERYPSSWTVFNTQNQVLNREFRLRSEQIVPWIWAKIRIEGNGSSIVSRLDEERPRLIRGNLWMVHPQGELILQDLSLVGWSTPPESPPGYLLRNLGITQFENVEVVDASAVPGPIRNHGTLKINRSLFRDNGPDEELIVNEPRVDIAGESSGTLEIRNTEFANNSLAGEAMILNNGQLRLENINAHDNSNRILVKNQVDAIANITRLIANRNLRGAILNQGQLTLHESLIRGPEGSHSPFVTESGFATVTSTRIVDNQLVPDQGAMTCSGGILRIGAGITEGVVLQNNGPLPSLPDDSVTLGLRVDESCFAVVSGSTLSGNRLTNCGELPSTFVDAGRNSSDDSSCPF